MDFPLTLKPAFTILAPVESITNVGELSMGGSHSYAQIAATGGTMKSEPGFEPAIKADFVHGGDFLHIDPDGKHIRWDVRALLKTEEGVNFTISITGVGEMTPGDSLVVQQSAEAATTQYGTSAGSLSIKCGDPRYKHLESQVFVGTHRHRVTGGRTAVEFMTFQVVPKPITS